MFRFILVLVFAFTVRASADPTVLLPMPPRAPGLTDAEYPVYRDYSYFKNFQDYIDQARSAPVDLLFDGDENTCYWRPGGGGNNVWKERYGSLNAIDFAPQYDKTQNLLWRLDNGELDGLHPELIVLQIGMNNLGDSPENIAAAIKLSVDTCRQRCPGSHVLLLGLFPLGPLSTDPARAKVKQVNQIISKFDDSKNVTYLDIGGKLLQPDGDLLPDLMPDSRHLSEKGFEVLADAIQPVIDRYCPKSAASPSTPFTPISGSEPALSWPLPPAVPGVASASYPVPPIGWEEYFFLRNADNLKKGPCDLIFDGDSITERWQNTGKDVWQKYYGSLKAVELGIGGDQVQNVLWRAQHGELDGQDPKLIVLLVGTNNHGQDIKGVAAGIKLIVDEYEKRCPDAHILLLGIFPNTAQPNTPARAWSAQVNSILATYDDGKRVTYLYIGDKFLQPDGTLTADIMPDFTHPSAKGYTIWADAIQPIVDKYLPKAVAK
jgi:lysophospholipase L1-like esterase